MNGPEHFAEAERLLVLAEQCDWTVEFSPYRDPALAAAKAHAWLALVAAVADLRLPARDHAFDSLVDRDLTHSTAPPTGTWAGVIRSTIGDPT